MIIGKELGRGCDAQAQTDLMRCWLRKRGNDDGTKFSTSAISLLNFWLGIVLIDNGNCEYVLKQIMANGCEVRQSCSLRKSFSRISYKVSGYVVLAIPDCTPIICSQSEGNMKGETLSSSVKRLVSSGPHFPGAPFYPFSFSYSRLVWLFSPGPGLL